MLHEHHPVPPNPMRNSRMGMQQMGPPPNQRTQPMLMSLQPQAVPVPHTGVLVSMPPGPPMVNAASLQHTQQPQPKNNSMQPVYHYEVQNPAESVEQGGEHAPPNISNTNTSSMPTNLANTKEKTPMCLVNELARYNKVQHQYRLTGEQGPAHKKIFTVALKLGNEEYEAHGPSIKKAQHSAAAISLERTQLKHPPPKTVRNTRPGLRSSASGMVTPTVELNALAMKRGERTIYVVENGAPPHHPNPMFQGYISQPGYYPRHNMYGPQGQPRYGYDARRTHNMRGHYQHYDNRFYGSYKPAGYQNASDPYTVRLRVGDREYPGIGPSVQAAKHDAAAKAIEDIKQLANDMDTCKLNELPPENVVGHDLNTDLKSPISLVHEIALKRNLNVAFEVLSEKGPPHMKVFITQCRVGELVADGEGNGKKISKKRAAEKMLEELAKLPPLPNMTSLAHLKRKRVTTKKKTRNLIKVNVDKSSDYVEDINPISRLIQIQQANKEKEPVYAVVEERGAPRRREFVIEASVNGQSCTGVGPNKKIAKRNAAEALLAALGYAHATPNPTATNNTNNPNSNPNPKPAIKVDKETETSTEKTRKVTFVEEKVESPSTVASGTSGRQLVPGLLLVGDQSAAAFHQNKQKPPPASNTESGTNNGGSNGSGQDTAKKGSVQASAQGGVRSKDQLMYLAQLMNIQVQFSDFPKANHEMYLTLVSLSTHPPQVCHGEGPTTEASHEKAALEALKVLSELGLDIVSPNNENQENANVITNSGSASPKSGLTQTQNGVKK